jgi:hypothetical protein
MKRAVLIKLLVAGALALVYFLSWASSVLSMFVPFLMPRATGSGGIGSVSRGFNPLEPVLVTLLLLASSLLLWRACAGLAAAGDHVMVWHRRFHGWAAIVGPLLVLSVAGLGALGFAMATPDSIRRGEDWMWFLAIAVLGLIIASFGLNVMQLYSVVVALKRRT